MTGARCLPLHPKILTSMRHCFHLCAARRRGVIDDSDDEAAAEVTPAPPMALGNSPVPTSASAGADDAAQPMELEAPPAAPAIEETKEEAAAAKPAAAPAKAAAAASSSSSSSASAPSKQPKATAAAKAKEAAPASSKDKDAEAGSDEDEDDDDDDDDDEAGSGDEEAETGGAAASSSASSKKPLALKQAGKGGKGKGKATKQGATASAVAYHKYDVLGSATWKAGQPVPYLFLARVFGEIEGESKRLLITEMMANAFRTVIATSPNDLGAVMALSTMRLAPAYEGIELGIGDQVQSALLPS